MILLDVIKYFYLYLIFAAIISVLTLRAVLLVAPGGHDAGRAQYRPDMHVEPTSVMDFYRVFVDMQRGLVDDALFENVFRSYVEKYRHKLNVRRDLPQSFSCVLELLCHDSLWAPVIRLGPRSVETRNKRYIFMANVLIDEGAETTFVNTNEGMLNINLITQGLFYRNVPTEVIEIYAAAGADVNHLFDLPYYQYPPGHHSFDLPYFWSGKQTPLTFVLQDDWGAVPVYDTSLWMASGYDEWLELVRVLIQSGADVHLTNEPGF